MQKKIVFELKDDGSCTIESPADLALTLGLLELAKDAARMKAAREAAQRKIELPEFGGIDLSNVSPFGRR